MDNQTWRIDATSISTHFFLHEITTYENEARHATGLMWIREHFVKEILCEFNKIRDMEYRMDGQMRRAVDYRLYGNFDGAPEDFGITLPTEKDYEVWETNLRKFFAAIFKFIENPSDANYKLMEVSDPRSMEFRAQNG